MTIQEFEAILYQKKVKGQKINDGQIACLRRLWPVVLTEIREQAVKDYKQWTWWKQIRMWFVRITRTS